MFMSVLQWLVVTIRVPMILISIRLVLYFVKRGCSEVERPWVGLGFNDPRLLLTCDAFGIRDATITARNK